MEDFPGDPGRYKLDLGAYISPRDLAQLFTSARQVLGYRSEDDSEVKYVREIQGFLTGEGLKVALGG